MVNSRCSGLFCNFFILQYLKWRREEVKRRARVKKNRDDELNQPNWIRVTTKTSIKILNKFLFYFIILYISSRFVYLFVGFGALKINWNIYFSVIKFWINRDLEFFIVFFDDLEFLYVVFMLGIAMTLCI